VSRLRAAFALRDARLVPALFDDDALRRLRAAVDLAPDVVEGGGGGLGATSAAVLRDVDVLITGWGAPVLDDALLAAAPRLDAVVHTAGTVKSFVTPSAWQRGVRVSSAATANARPVAEYTLAMVLLAGKRVLAAAQQYDRYRAFDGWSLPEPLGNNGLTVGIVGASRVGRQVMTLLAPFDVRVLLHDPWVDAAEAGRLGAASVSLDDLLAGSDVVSLHAPALPETTRMIGARELARMPDGATLVNTARGALVDTAALTAEVLAGRLHAVLDVTDPEPLPADHPLFGAPGVLLTPHVAGSAGNELRRLGASAAAEVERLAAGQPLRHEVRPDQLATSA
jgi:phosphoglycerate dehydrogenase-like enzyme